MAKPSQRLSGFLSFFSGRYAPAFLTFLLLAAGFFLYFEVIVSKNENDLKQRCFRGLQRMANNISNKLENYHSKNTVNFFHDLSQDRRPALKKAIRADYGIDTIVPATSIQKEVKRDTALVGYWGQWMFLFQDTLRQIAGTRVSNFVTPLFRRDLFSNYLFGYQDTILVDELNITYNRFSTLLFKKEARDTVKKNIIETGQIWNLEISGKPYKLFLLHFTVMDHYRFTLGGYMTEDQYEDEKNLIPIYAILWLIIGLILVVLMFPLLKLFLIHRSEQLMVRDAISSLASIHVLGAITILAALNTYVYFAMSIPALNGNLKSLATTIENTLRSEITAALGDIDSTNQKIKHGFPFQNEDSLLTRRVKDTPPQHSTLFTRQAGLHYLFLENLTWTDSSGINVQRWTTKPFLPSLINVNDRDYYQAVRNGNLWHWNNGDSFYFSSISSWNSDENLAIIATPFTAGKPKIQMTTLSGPFRSLFDVILPQGYGFCIIDQNGLVKFHQDQKHNLNENLLEETDDNNTLKSILYSHSKAVFAARYSGENNRFYVKPLAGTPYFLVTFCDIEQLWSEDLDVISVCSILSLMNLAIILIVILTVQLSGYKDSLLKNQSILFTWLRPSPSLKPAYSRVTLLYLSSMIIQLLFFMIHKGKDYLSLVGIAFSFSFILISYAYYQFAIASNTTSSEKVQKIRSLYWLAALFVFVNIVFGLNLGSDWYYFFPAELLLLSVAVLISLKKKKKVNRQPLNSAAGISKYNILYVSNKNFRWWYMLSFFSFVTSTSVMPLIIFYFISFKHERLLSLKRNQMEFAGQLYRKNYGNTQPSKNTLQVSYELPYHYTNIADQIFTPSAEQVEQDTSINKFDYLFNKIKPAFSLYSKEFSFLNNSQDSAVRYNWLLEGDSALVLHYYSLYDRSNQDSGRGLIIRSHIESGMKKTGTAIRQDYLSFLIFTASVILLLTGFNYLVRRLLNKVFFDGYDASATSSESDIALLSQLPENEHVFISGPPNSSKYQRLHDTMDASLLLWEFDCVKLLNDDIKTITSQFTFSKISFNSKPEGQHPIVIIRHFELFASNAVITEKKLQLLEFLLQQKVHIIVLSARSFEAMPLNLLPSSIPDTKYAEERWSNVMNNFYMLYHCWQKPKKDPLEKEISEASKKIKDYAMSCFQNFKISHPLRRYCRNQLVTLMRNIDDECAHSDFLWALRKPIFTFLDDHKTLYLKLDYLKEKHNSVKVKMAREFSLLFEQICLKIQSLSSNYYLSLWQSLSRDEQRTLYDISLDEIVNPANRDIAIKLAGWGLVIPETSVACYHIMNNSFRNFIFSQLNKSELEFIKTEAAEKGSWNTFQLPVLLTVLGVGLFLFITQRDAFTNLVSYLGAAAAGIAALLKILGMIPNSKT